MDTALYLPQMNRRTRQLFDAYAEDLVDIAFDILCRRYPNWNRAVFDEYEYMSLVVDECRTYIDLDCYASCVEFSFDGIDFDLIGEAAAQSALSTYSHN